MSVDKIPSSTTMPAAHHRYPSPTPSPAPSSPWKSDIISHSLELKSHSMILTGHNLQPRMGVRGTRLHKVKGDGQNWSAKKIARGYWYYSIRRSILKPDITNITDPGKVSLIFIHKWCSDEVCLVPFNPSITTRFHLLGNGAFRSKV